MRHFHGQLAIESAAERDGLRCRIDDALRVLESERDGLGESVELSLCELEDVVLDVAAALLGCHVRFELGSLPRQAVANGVIVRGLFSAQLRDSA